jgi:hypothetical protein
MMLLQHSATIRRHAAVGTNGRKTLADLYKGVRCLLLPMNDTTSIRHEFQLGRAYDVYFNPGQDIKIGDQVIVDGDRYSVRQVQVFKVAVVGHTRALCEMEVN